MNIVIKGEPFSRWKVRGNIKGRQEWAKRIIEQTAGLPKVDYPCEAEIEFIFPKNKYPTDLPYGPDLDNFLKPLLDSLQKTFLENDSLIIKIMASKRCAKEGEETGVKIKIGPYLNKC